MNKIYYIFLILVIYILYRSFYYEKCTVNNYLNKIQLEKTLINNKDKYYEKFNENDLRVRDINNINEYHDIIKNSCINISSNYSKILDEAINVADIKIKKIKINGFDGKKAGDLQWTIGVFKDKKYEYGLPHTRNLIIVIPEIILNNFYQLVQVLIHEKIHIYQKMYPNDVDIWLNENGFIKYKLRNIKDNTRANPDIDNYLYKNINNDILQAVYNELPFTINDVKYYPINNSKYEHPFEYMAYTLEELINK